jgi:hypothetical protein
MRADDSDVDFPLPLPDEDCSPLQDATSTVDSSEFLAQVLKWARKAAVERHVKAPVRAAKEVAAQALVEIRRDGVFHTRPLDEWVPGLIGHLFDCIQEHPKAGSTAAAAASSVKRTAGVSLRPVASAVSDEFFLGLQLSKCRLQIP